MASPKVNDIPGYKPYGDSSIGDLAALDPRLEARAKASAANEAASAAIGAWFRQPGFGFGPSIDASLIAAQSAERAAEAAVTGELALGILDKALPDDPLAMRMNNSHSRAWGMKTKGGQYSSRAESEVQPPGEGGNPSATFRDTAGRKESSSYPGFGTSYFGTEDYSRTSATSGGYSPYGGKSDAGSGGYSPYTTGSDGTTAAGNSFKTSAPAAYTPYEAGSSTNLHSGGYTPYSSSPGTSGKCPPSNNTSGSSVKNAAMTATGGYYSPYDNPFRKTLNAITGTLALIDLAFNSLSTSLGGEPAENSFRDLDSYTANLNSLAQTLKNYKPSEIHLLHFRETEPILVQLDRLKKKADAYVVPTVSGSQSKFVYSTSNSSGETTTYVGDDKGSPAKKNNLQSISGALSHLRMEIANIPT
jgi:hypothetical protein